PRPERMLPIPPRKGWTRAGSVDRTSCGHGREAFSKNAPSSLAGQERSCRTGRLLCALWLSPLVGRRCARRREGHVKRQSRNKTERPVGRSLWIALGGSG